MIVSYLISCALYLCLVQAELEVLFEDGGCTRSNDEYIKPDSCEFEVEQDSEYGTSVSMSIEVTKKVPSLTALATVLGLERDGEYTVDFGIHVEIDVCQTLSGPVNVAFPIIKAMNIPPDRCPPEPGVYGSEHYVIEKSNSDGLPESFPSGKYLFNVTLLTEEGLLIVEYVVYVSVL
nr:uncharacterized protein LOC117218316 [Megalopta genalis]